MSLYTLRVTYREPSGRVKVQQVRNLDWLDAYAISNIVARESTTMRTDIKIQTSPRVRAS